jgi:diadenosine tetraphosphatase ApaH/serine/threonine PP2A family protein phosphatase
MLVATAGSHAALTRFAHSSRVAARSVACGRLPVPCSSRAQIPVPEAESSQMLIVVGDTHGQLADVLYIFSVHGPPSAQNTYLFNGDIADRGPSACEIVLLLLTYKLACPTSIYINRGNHENLDINERPAKNGGGFGAEVRAKYDRETFMLFQRFFCTLPLATVLGDECIVVHGGLCRLNPSLEAMSLVDREMQCPDNPHSNDETILFDSLWADPAADGEPAGAGRGGVCYSFDEVATTKFLTDNGLSLVIRSHQLPPKQRGYMLHHSNKVLTVFSASNYCGICANHGSILILRGGMSEVWEYRAPPLETLLQTWEEVKAARANERKKRAFATVTKSRSLLGIADVAAAQIRTNRWGGMSKERRVQIGSADGTDHSASGKKLTGLILSEYEMEDSKAAGPSSAGMDVSVVRALKERICINRGELLRAFQKGESARLPRGKSKRAHGREARSEERTASESGAQERAPRDGRLRRSFPCLAALSNLRPWLRHPRAASSAHPHPRLSSPCATPPDLRLALRSGLARARTAAAAKVARARRASARRAHRLGALLRAARARRAAGRARRRAAAADGQHQAVARPLPDPAAGGLRRLAEHDALVRVHQAAQLGPLARVAQGALRREQRRHGLRVRGPAGPLLV